MSNNECKLRVYLVILTGGRDMGLIHKSEDELAEIENTKKINIEKLNLVRKTYPEEVTAKEISILQDLVEHSHNLDEKIDFIWPTIERVKSAEQVGDLMKKVMPSTNFWLKTFYGLEDTAKDRALGKNIIQALAQRDMNYTGEYGLVDYYKKMLRGTNDNHYPQKLVQDPEMASEILKALNDKLQKKNNEGNCYGEDITETRYFLSDNNTWNNVAANKGNKLSLKNNYVKLTQTIQDIEIAMLKKRHLEDTKNIDSLFRDGKPSIDKSIERK